MTNIKIRDVTVPLKPAYVYMCCNEWINVQKRGSILITMANNTIPEKLSQEHLESIRARILEVYFRKQSSKVDKLS